jgi:hypothetical protein
MRAIAAIAALALLLIIVACSGISVLCSWASWPFETPQGALRASSTADHTSNAEVEGCRL